MLQFYADTTTNRKKQTFIHLKIYLKLESNYCNIWNNVINQHKLRNTYSKRYSILCINEIQYIVYFDFQYVN